MIRTIIAAAACCGLALAQTPASPSFEVASIKPSGPMEMGRIMMGIAGGPGTPDPGQFRASNLPLSRLIMAAYDVKSYQVTGPSWMDTTRFDIVAKVPMGATKEEFRQMLQNLLKERFKLVIHKESKDEPIYALLVGKNGVKMKESAPLDPEAEKTAPAFGGRGPGEGGGRGPGGPGTRMSGRGMMVSMGPNGLHMQGAHASIGQIADFLSNQLGRPVVDMTGMTKEYDYTLDFSAEGLQLMKGVPAMPPPGGGREGGPDGGRESGPNLVTAVQEQLGLRLESRKGPVDLIVVDSADKTPTEN